jgi:hypothetical protein
MRTAQAPAARAYRSSGLPRPTRCTPAVRAPSGIPRCSLLFDYVVSTVHRRSRSRPGLLVQRLAQPRCPSFRCRSLYDLAPRWPLHLRRHERIRDHIRNSASKYAARNVHAPPKAMLVGDGAETSSVFTWPTVSSCRLCLRTPITVPKPLPGPMGYDTVRGQQGHGYGRRVSCS